MLYSKIICSGESEDPRSPSPSTKNYTTLEEREAVEKFIPLSPFNARFLGCFALDGRSKILLMLQVPHEDS